MCDANMFGPTCLREVADHQACRVFLEDAVPSAEECWANSLEYGQNEFTDSNLLCLVLVSCRG